MELADSYVWIWLVLAVLFVVGEMSSPGSFFLLPFAAGALVASGIAFVTDNFVLQLAVFVVISGGTFAGMRPLARRLDRAGTDRGIGSRRLIGQEALVTSAIPEGDLGIVKVQREDWRAESVDGTPIAEGTKVRVAEVEGTRVLVAPIESAPSSTPAPTLPPDTPPTTPSEGA